MVEIGYRNLVQVKFALSLVEDFPGQCFQFSLRDLSKLKDDQRNNGNQKNVLSGRLSIFILPIGH